MAAPGLQPVYKLSRELKLQFLHNYRLLLRETTYLPDSWAREYWRNYIVTRFRHYQPRKPASSPEKTEVPTKIPYKKRAGSLLKLSTSYIRILARANEGFPQDLSKVLSYAYGRSGPRKHALLAPYWVEPPPKDDVALKELISAENEHKIDRGPELPPAIRAIARAQRSQPDIDLPNAPIKAIKAEIPEKNSWGYPIPLKRVRNIKKKFILEIRSKIMPPLPRDEWERLRDLALGTEKWEDRKQRRAGYEKNLEHRSGFIIKRRGVPGQRIVTPRYMRRRWSILFRQSPVMDKDENTGEWKVTWGKAAKPGIPEPSEAEAELFEDAEDDAQAKGYWSQYNYEIYKKRNQIKSRTEDEVSEQAGAGV